MYHQSGIRRPRGGSGMLTQALARMIQAHGGAIIAGAPVTRILTERDRAVGAETSGGIRVTARAVVSGAHIHTTMRLLEDAPVAGQARRLAKQSRIGNGFGMIVRYAMNELPNYRALPSPADGTFRMRGALKDAVKRSVILILCVWKSAPQMSLRRCKWPLTRNIALLVDHRAA